MQFINLPEELIVQIFENLSLQDLISCSLTCRLFHVTIRDALILQYHVELAVAGVEESGTTSRLTVADRRAELDAVTKGWANLRFRERHSVFKSSNNLWELFGSVMAYGVGAGGTHGLAFIELPSVVRGSHARRWEHRDMGLRFRDFGIDPAQDLAVLISHPVNGPVPNVHMQEYSIHLRAMSTGEKHPQAENAILTCIPDPIDPRCGFITQVMDQFLAILFHTVTRRTQDQLFIWNWKTGRVVTDFRLSPTNRTRIDSFSFLSPRHFVIARFQPDTWAPDPPALEVYDFLAPQPAESTNPQLVRSFQLPQVAANALVASILTRSDPSPQCGSPASRTDARPFSTAPTSRLLAVSIDIFRHMDDFCTFVLFVHHSALLDGLDPESYSDEIVVPWRDWGPEKSRMLTTLYNEPSWVCYVHGMRYVRLEPLREDDFGGLGQTRLRMLDFNPLSLKRGQGPTSEDASPPSPAAEPGLSYEIVTASQPTVIPANDTFAEDVVTSLPYSDVRSGETFSYFAVMIDEECVVAVKRVASFGPVDALEFLCI